MMALALSHLLSVMKLIALLLALSWCSGVVLAQESCQEENDLRLQGLGLFTAGRVEVCVGGVWGTVCTISSRAQWSLKSAQVVCRQLGFVTAVTALPQDSLIASIRADVFVPVHFDDVVCDGTETTLEECDHSTNIPDECLTHFTDAAIVCSTELDSPGSITPGSVRFVGDTADYIGAVEYYDVVYEWTGICADSDHSNDWINSGAASVVCEQLGFEGGRPYVQSISGLDLSVVVECDSGDFTLEDCDREGVILTGGCSSQEAGWVECRETGEDDFTVRINGGSREGVVEVSYNGRWGTVCEDGLWLDPNAQVVCTELGLDSDIPPSVFPAGNYDQYMSSLKPFWLSEVICDTQLDSSLEQCNYDLLIGYSTACSNANAASVFNSAEVNCGPAIPFSLSGGQIAGIVIGSLAFVTIVVLIGIYGPEKWKKRHTYPLWRTLSSPRTWCEGTRAKVTRWWSSHRPGRRRTATIATRVSSNENTEYPPATFSRASETTASTEQGSSTSVELGQSQERETVERVGRGAGALLGFGVSSPPTEGQRSQSTLTGAAPPTYQAAVSYPVVQPDLPPAYFEKKFPPLSSDEATGGATPSAVGLPYPEIAHNPAYPPPPL